MEIFNEQMRAASESLDEVGEWLRRRQQDDINFLRTDPYAQSVLRQLGVSAEDAVYDTMTGFRVSSGLYELYAKRAAQGDREAAKRYESMKQGHSRWETMMEPSSHGRS